MKKAIQSLLPIVLMICTVFSLLNLPALAAESERNAAPWDISETDESGNVTAWYEGDADSGYILHIDGNGRMTASFRDAAGPWENIKQNIIKVIVGEGITNVGAYAFNFCRRLSEVTLPESLTEIGTYAFHSTGVKHLVIPAGVNKIGRMIATPNTYYEVLGNPAEVNDHAFSTSLVSAIDTATANALNGKTNVSALIVLNGGAYGEKEGSLENRAYGLTEPVRAGYKFKGWYRDAALTKPCKISEDGRAIVHINHVYYAKWVEGTEPVSYTVTFDSQGGSAVTSQTVTEGGKVSAPADPVRTGYTFGGWFTDPGCTKAWSFDSAVTGDLTLYAKWTETQPGNPNNPDTPVYPGPPGGPGTPSKPGTPSTPGTPGTPGAPGASATPEEKPVVVEKTTLEGNSIVSKKTSGGDVSITVTSPSGDVMVSMILPAKVPAAEKKFTDVPDSHYAAEAISQAVSMGLINGVGNNNFGPETPVNRAMFAAILCRMAGMEGKEYVNIFTDVSTDHYAKNAIAWANKLGVVNGYGSTFAPEAKIKREDMAVMLYRFAKALGMDVSSNPAVLAAFKDRASISGYATEAMAWCVGNGLLNGTGNGVIDPGAFTRRCDAVLLLQRFMDLVKS